MNGTERTSTNEFQRQADRQCQLFAPLQPSASLEPLPHHTAVVTQRLREAIDPKQQQIHECEDRSCYDQLLRQKASQRQIAGQRAHDDRHNDGPDGHAERAEQTRRRNGTGSPRARRAQKRNNEAGRKQA